MTKETRVEHGAIIEKHDTFTIKYDGPGIGRCDGRLYFHDPALNEKVIENTVAKFDSYDEGKTR